MNNFSVYDFFIEPVFVLNNQNEFCYSNNAYKEIYPQAINDINKLSTYFDFDIGIIDSSKIYDVNPILLGINSNENYSCSALNVQDGLNYEIFATIFEGYKIFIIRNTKEGITHLDERIKELEDKNKKIELLSQKAQSQAVKINLLNRIYTILQNENELSNILSLIYTELADVFGVDKLFYADNDKIKYIYPNAYDYALNKKISGDYDKTKIYNAVNYFKDFDFFKTNSNNNSTRITVPVNEQQKQIGLVVFSLPYKNFVMIDEDFLNSLCSEISSAVLQAILTQRLKENQLQLINSEKMATLGNMIAAVAHEINTPIGSINSNNEIISKILEKNINAENEKAFKMINMAISTDKEAIKRIMTIVKALKKFIRLDEAKMQLTDVSKELDLTLDLCQHILKNKVTVIKEYGNVEEIYTHPNMLNQVFMNILTNAAQSIKEKGEIKIAIFQNENYIIISIKDNGNGIPDNIKEKIFEQGFTTKSKEEGSGLGLSISQKIMEQLGGELNFTSKENIGTEFLIKLPKGENK